MKTKLTNTFLFAVLIFNAVVLHAQKDTTGTDNIWSGDLLPVTIKPYEPDSVWGSKALNVADFIVSDSILILLTYQKEERWKRQEDSKITLFNGASLLLVRADQDTARLMIPDLVMGLVDHPVFGVFVETHHAFLHLDIAANRFDEVTSKDDFDLEIAPVIGEILGYSMISTFSADLPYMDLYLHCSAANSNTKLIHIEDKVGRDLFMSEYKYLHPKDKVVAMNYELSTGVQKEVVAAFMSGFQDKYYFEELNNPAFTQGNQWVVFNHNANAIIRYSFVGKELSSSNIDYHLNKKRGKWSEEILKDNSNQTFYTTTNHNGNVELFEIATNTGEMTHVIRLYFKYVEKIKVFNGEVYYIYRPFESSQKRYLYKESIFAKP
ncbi:MAG: hypothetical protein R2809_11695 [Flavobacteriales bacterium]